MFSILHISDLHRSREEPVDNDSLLAALLADRDRYAGETPRIPEPQAIVVSGDLIQGARLDDPNWQQSIRDQYTVADRFLTALCERFLDGDRSRMVLVPGNHDVCWNTSHRAMERVPDIDYPSDLYETLKEPDTLYRWSWSDRALYRIVHTEAYQRRLHYYWNFAESFYSGTNMSIPIDQERGFQLFEFLDRRIIVSAFESVSGNDCFGYSGSIPRSAIGQCAMTLRDSGRSYDLKIAIWHHSIQGPPVNSDYMDVSQVREMIGHGFQLGLHGHQHKAATQTQFVHLDQSRSMAVVGAGSLCAGAREMPRGVNRQYNLIVIENDFIKARVHVREMAEGQQFTRKLSGAFSDGFVKISWHPPLNVMGGSFDAQAENDRRATIDAETALRDDRPNDALRALHDVNILSTPYARKLMIEALQIQEDWPRLTELLQNPATDEEIVILVSALIESDEFEIAQTRLDGATELDAATHSALQSRLEARKMMRCL